MTDINKLSTLFTQLISTSEEMLSAANSDNWDEVMDLDKTRYTLLDALLKVKQDLSSSTFHQQSSTLSQLDSEINKVLKATQQEHALNAKQAKNNRLGMNQYLDGQALPVS